MLIKFPVWAYNSTIGKALNKQTQDAQVGELLDDTMEDEDENEVALKSAAQPNGNAETRKRTINRR